MLDAFFRYKKTEDNWQRRSKQEIKILYEEPCITSQSKTLDVKNESKNNVNTTPGRKPVARKRKEQKAINKETMEKYSVSFHR